MNFIDTLKNKKILINNQEYPLLKLGDFFKLDIYRVQLQKATNDKDKKLFAETIKNIVDLQTNGQYKPKTLYETLYAVFTTVRYNFIRADAAFLKIPTSQKKPSEIESTAWDYDGRTLAIWVDAFASHYHWTLEDILNLNLDTAVYLYQEILISDQYKREWEYSLTELAYSYDETSHSSKINPLPRPDWMKTKISGDIPVTRLEINMLPMGNVVDLGGMGVMSRNEQNPKLVPDPIPEKNS